MAKRISSKKFILWTAVILGLFLTGIVFLYVNLNRLLTNALNNGFNANLISDVYELKFEDLDVNILTGSVKVVNVKLYPREKPLRAYAYINSSFRLEARRMLLKNVDLLKLLRYNKLDLHKIELVEPGIDFRIADVTPVFFPFKEKVSASQENSTKKSIESYTLKEFKMVDAYFHVVNSAKLRRFDIQRINLTLEDMVIDQQPGLDRVSYRKFDFFIGELTGNLEDKDLRYVNFKDFNVKIDSLDMEQTRDTLIYHFADINSSIKNLDIQTADSLYHLVMESFDLCYKKKSIALDHLSFTPNISNTALQKMYAYRKENFAGTIGSIKVQGLNFDSLLYQRKLSVEQILLDDVSLSIYKDLRKPFPPDHRPAYLGQQIGAISMPLAIREINVTRLNLVNTEVTPDGAIGKANINRGTVKVDNLTNLPGNEMLIINGDAYVENAAHAYLQLRFNYHEPQFSIDGEIKPFDLTRLNALTDSYAPARIKKGMVDGITFSGMVYHTRSTGTMTFLYHDLVVDLELEDKAKWKSTLLGFAANTYLNAANPISDKLPAREVRFEVVRDMRKGYLSMLIKSVLDGVKETFIMSKENKQAYRDAKVEAKSKTKEERKN